MKKVITYGTFDLLHRGHINILRRARALVPVLVPLFVSAFRRADQFRGDSAVTTWLHRIVVNASLDRLRRRAARPAQPLPDDLDDLPGATLADPVDEHARRETQLVVTEALASLPDDQRAAVLLVDVEGLSIEEAAVRLGCPEGTVKSRCFRGRAKLAKRLDFLRNPDADTTVTTVDPTDKPTDKPTDEPTRAKGGDPSHG